MVNRIYPPELQLNKANTSDTEAPFLDLLFQTDLFHLKFMISAMTLIFVIVNFPFLDGDVPSYGVYVSQLIRFARVSSHVAEFNPRNKSLTAKLLQQGYLYHKLLSVVVPYCFLFFLSVFILWFSYYVDIFCKF